MKTVALIGFRSIAFVYDRTALSFLPGLRDMVGTEHRGAQPNFRRLFFAGTQASRCSSEQPNVLFALQKSESKALWVER
jgi:hypothetical protein